MHVAKNAARVVLGVRGSYGCKRGRGWISSQHLVVDGDIAGDVASKFEDKGGNDAEADVAVGCSQELIWDGLLDEGLHLGVSAVAEDGRC